MDPMGFLVTLQQRPGHAFKTMNSRPLAVLRPKNLIEYIAMRKKSENGTMIPECSRSKHFDAISR
jgi:hypothetical protein